MSYPNMIEEYKRLQEIVRTVVTRLVSVSSPLILTLDSKKVNSLPLSTHFVTGVHDYKVSVVEDIPDFYSISYKNTSAGINTTELIHLLDKADNIKGES